MYGQGRRVDGLIDASGEDGEQGCAENANWCGTADGSSDGYGPSEAESGGGGAGGAIYLVTDALSASSDSVLAGGGAGIVSGSSWARVSGDGGDGRVRLDASTVNGETAGTTAAETEADDLAEPDPGYLSTP